MELPDLLQDPNFRPTIECPDSTGLTPLLLAITLGTSQGVTAALTAGASLRARDRKGNTVFHHAAKAPLVVLQTLVNVAEQTMKQDMKELTALINQANSGGQSALYLAWQGQRQDCMIELICGGADLNTLASQGPNQQNPFRTTSGPHFVEKRNLFRQHPRGLSTVEVERGGSPAHWATGKAVLEGLLELDCDREGRNMLGETPLHVMVREGRLDCAVSLLRRGAEVNAMDNAGNTALHLAVKMANLALIKAVLVFGADWTLMNRERDTPWTLTLRTFESKFEDVERNKNMVLHCLHAVGAEVKLSMNIFIHLNIQGPLDLLPNTPYFKWKPLEEIMYGKRTR